LSSCRNNQSEGQRDVIVEGQKTAFALRSITEV